MTEKRNKKLKRLLSRILDNIVKTAQRDPELSKAKTIAERLKSILKKKKEQDNI